MSNVSLPLWCDEQSTIPRLLVKQAEKYGSKPYFISIEEPEPITYEGLLSAAGSAAAGLARYGCQPGEMAALFLPNGGQFVHAWFASLFAGMSDVPINVDFRKSFLLFALTNTQAKMVFTDAAGVAALLDDEVKPYLKNLRLVVLAEGAGDIPGGLAADGLQVPVVSMAELRSGGAKGRAWESVNASHMASIRFTSGTTGPAKGAMQSHLHILNKSRVHLEVMEMVEGDMLYSPFPLHHNLASINGLISTLQAGSTFCSARRFSASRFWDEARSVGATIGHILYPLLPTLLTQPPSDLDDKHDLRYLWMGWPHREFEERFKTRLVQVYALGEVGVISYRRGGRYDNACGEPIPEMEVRIVDNMDRPLPPGTSGEITVRPRQPHRVMLGYMNNLPATMRTFRNLWFHTSDRGVLAADGQLHFEGRIGDTIRRRGVNISSEQIEDEVLRHENVRECAVIGVPSPLGEEDIQACIIWREAPKDTEAAITELIDFANSRLPKGYVPRYFEIVPSFMRTDTGKVRKSELRERSVTGPRWDRDTSKWADARG